jgi:glucose-6-phosphate 1-dehydrogenase
MIQFRCAPHIVFREREIEPNRLILNIQPEEGISVSFGAKRPGTEMRIGNVTMNFSYKEGFGDVSRSAYATLVNDCLRGDATLFDRGDNVEAAWALVDPILDVWSAARTGKVPEYAAGSWGPRESDLLLERDDRQWYNPLFSFRTAIANGSMTGGLGDSCGRRWRHEMQSCALLRKRRQAHSCLQTALCKQRLCAV